MLFLLVLNLELCKPATATSLSPNKEQKGRKKKVEQKMKKINQILKSLFNPEEDALEISLTYVPFRKLNLYTWDIYIYVYILFKLGVCQLMKQTHPVAVTCKLFHSKS